MTFNDLVGSSTTQLQEQTRLFARLQNKPFWIWDKQQHKLEAYRALDNHPKLIPIDEVDFLRKGEQGDVMDVSERCIGKSDPYIVMTSTANEPDGLFERIEKESEETCIFRLYLWYW